MALPHRVILRRGVCLPAGALSVARPTRYGNPFKVKPYGPYDLAEALVLYERHLRAGTLISRPGRTPTTIAEVRARLRGKDLACYCPLSCRCHADILLVIANPGLPWPPITFAALASLTSSARPSSSGAASNLITPVSPGMATSLAAIRAD